MALAVPKVAVLVRKAYGAGCYVMNGRAYEPRGDPGLIDPYRAARNDMIDDVIDPRETRPTVIRALAMAAGKRRERPWKRNAVVPV